MGLLMYSSSCSCAQSARGTKPCGLHAASGALGGVHGDQPRYERCPENDEGDHPCPLHFQRNRNDSRPPLGQVPLCHLYGARYCHGRLENRQNHGAQIFKLEPVRLRQQTPRWSSPARRSLMRRSARHTITFIFGVGSTKRLTAVRWGSRGTSSLHGSLPFPLPIFWRPVPFSF